MNTSEQIHILTHPLLQHKITLMRNKDTGTNEFRKLVEEIAVLEGYEALKDMELETVTVETPIEQCQAQTLAGKKPVVVPILRAGLGMVPGILSLIPNAKVGHIGMSRNEQTFEPEVYYCKMPKALDQRLTVVVDPMLATGGSASAALTMLKQKGAKKIKFICIIAAPVGLETLSKAHPDVEIYVGHLDRELNDKAYICPGLGDAGDRIFGTL